MKLNAIGFFVKDIKVMTAFYKDVMKMKQNVDMEGFAGFETEDGFFFNLCDREFIINGTPLPLEFTKGLSGNMQLSFGVESYADVDTEFNRLIESGATAVIEPNSKPYGLREAYVADPEGNLIEIVSSNP